MEVYDVKLNVLLGQLRAFRAQPIHGIYISEGDGDPDGSGPQILLWGGHSVTLLPPTTLQSLIEGRTPAPPDELKATDWIYDGILFSSAATGTEGALVTAHNEIIPLLAGVIGGPVRFGPLVSPSRPILYSANLRLVSPNIILVAGGTVFGEIIVWRYYLDPARSCQPEVLFVFTGHEGSIFGVSISPEFEISPDTKVRLLASCSDDRTIRVWDITEHPSKVEESGPLAVISSEARETGFGEQPEAGLLGRNDSSRCVAVEMGHISRIWHVKFTGSISVESPQETSIEIYSFGEDCTRQKWELSLDLPRWRNAATSCLDFNASPLRQLTGTLRLRGAGHCHSGKNIWSAAASMCGSSSLIVSGGADGKVMISEDSGALGGSPAPDDARQSRDSSHDIDICLSFDEFIQSAPAPTATAYDSPSVTRVAITTKDTFHRYTFLSEQTLLITTAAGRLFLGKLGVSVAWEEVLIPDSIRSDIASFHFHVVRSLPQGKIAIGTVSGRVYLLCENNRVTELTHLSSKITDIFHLKRRNRETETGCPRLIETLLITVLGQKCATMLHYDTASGAVVGDAAHPMFDSEYSNYIVTSASYCGNFLLLGFRMGVLSFYENTSGSWQLVESRKDCSSKDAITCILPLPGSSTSFLTTCRDGKYRIYTIDIHSSTTALQLHHEISPPLGVIEDAWFVKPGSRSWELVLQGFRGKNFVAWNETARQELAVVECGAHRPFSCVSSPSDAGRLSLAFIKASQLRVYTQARPSLRVLKEGCHGREIRAVASCGDYLATAAEDTSIRIWQYKNSADPKRRGLKCLAILEKHSAGIKALKWHGSNYILSSAGNEEFYIWRVTRLDSEYETLAVVCEAVYPHRSTYGDLRIMNFDVQSWGAEGDEMLISLTLSNSTLRTYRYSRPLGFQLLSAGSYTGACLTQIRHLRTEENEIHILTASTDGHLAIWSSTRGSDIAGQDTSYSELNLVAATKLHQSTVKSMDIFVKSSRSSWLAVSGGDDNALGFAYIEWVADRQECSVVSRSRIKSAHAAAVTGLCVLRGDGRMGTMEVATASNDQRVKLWRISRDAGEVGSGIRVSLLDDQYSSVADAGDLEVVSPGLLMVGGVGLEVWEV